MPFAAFFTVLATVLAQGFDVSFELRALLGGEHVEDCRVQLPGGLWSARAPFGMRLVELPDQSLDLLALLRAQVNAAHGTVKHAGTMTMRTMHVHTAHLSGAGAGRRGTLRGYQGRQRDGRREQGGIEQSTGEVHEEDSLRMKVTCSLTRAAPQAL